MERQSPLGCPTACAASNKQQTTSSKGQGARGQGPGTRGVQVQRETPRSGAQEHTEERCEGAGRALEQLQQLESDSRVTGAHHSKVSRVRLSEQQHRGGVHQTGVAAPESNRQHRPQVPRQELRSAPWSNFCSADRTQHCLHLIVPLQHSL